jgi:3-methyladenine DNA glycosylase AlkC
VEPWSDQEARWIRRAAEDVIRERRPPGHELTAEEDREVNRIMVNRRLAGEARDLETYRIVNGHLVRLYAESYARWRRGAGARLRTSRWTPRRRTAG